MTKRTNLKSVNYKMKHADREKIKNDIPAEVSLAVSLMQN